ncbi:GNAT family N-acetyltransferase [Kineococcus sp. SYSU DK006]|uniref:GNAT family N-acetyltransferase n=1 Tax=Kineococcus sp. SYSU DK006 TaxID=3383127 RepID=UPI003D7EEF0D
MDTLPGLSTRPLTEDDVAAWWRLQDRAAGVDRPSCRDSEDWLRSVLAAEGFDARRQSVAGVDATGELRAAASVGLRLGDVSQLRLVLDGVVDPAWRGRGIGTALLAWGRATAAERAAARRAELGRQVPGELQVWVEEGREDLRSLCERHGLRVRRWFSTVRLDLRPGPPPARQAPPGFRLLVLEEAAARLGVPFEHVDEQLRGVHNEVFADHWGSQPLSRADWSAFVTGSSEYRRDLSLLVLGPDGAIAAYADVYAHPGDWPALGFPQAELGHLGVRRPHRGRGLATLLLAAVARRAAAAGMAAVALDVDSENPSGAVGLYERAGYVPVVSSSLWALPV